MHYAVIIPTKTKESAKTMLSIILQSGLMAFIEERDSELTKKTL